MTGRIRLNLHCHSNLSDGVLTPESLAGRLADEGASVAALTDHDTVEGTARFRDALSLRGVAFVDALELTTFCSFGEIHLLAYGIDPESPELRTALSAIGEHAEAEVQGFMDYIRRFSTHPPAGKLETEAAIALVHRCGGIAVLAHPLDLSFTSGNLETLLQALAKAGLDGLEAVYGPYSDDERDRLRSLAQSQGLCVSMGTDFHVPDDPAHRATMEVDGKEWQAFRDRLLRRTARTISDSDASTGRAHKNIRPSPLAEGMTDRIVPSGFRLGKFSARIIAASVLALGLFVIAIFAVSIPYFEKTLLERKKEMIRELTAEAVSLIAEYNADELSGRMDRAEAQANAIAHIRDIRYGREGKDYFWITDLTPRMLLHPYRKDLEGKDVSDFQDDRGLRVFYEFTRAVRADDEGYVEYLWQWKDDAERIVPKLSFVKRFVPWGWIIGTGIYLDDVQQEIRALTGRMVWLSLLIALILMFLLAFIALQSLSLEKKKQAVDFAVRESKERYRALVEASSEGMVIVIDGSCTFANAPFIRLSGYGEAEIVLLKISEFLVPYRGEEETALGFLAALPHNGNAANEEGADSWNGPEPSLACLFRRRSGELVDVVVNASSFSLAGKRGTVLAVKEARIPEAVPSGSFAATGGNASPAELLSMGSFRARLNRHAGLLAADSVARRLLGLDEGADRSSLANRFAETEEWDDFYTELVSARKVLRKAVRLRRPADAEDALPKDGSRSIFRSVLLTASVEDGEVQNGLFFSAIVEEPGSDAVQLAALREELREVEVSDRFMDEPIPTAGISVPRIDLGATVRSAARAMVHGGSDALVIRGPAGEDLGIVTDADLRSRVIAEDRDPETTVGLVLSAPLASVADGATWADALRLMRERGLGHVAVRDGKDGVKAVVGYRDFARMKADGFGPLRDAVRSARNLNDLASIRSRMEERARLSVSLGTAARLVAFHVSSISDAIVSRLLEFAAADLGKSPSPFSFLALGSLGRTEALPSSDQDNAIVYLDVPSGPDTRPYFLSLGAYVCDALNLIGVPYCPGGVMAKNVPWCAGLGEWEKKFGAWIVSPDPEEMLSLNMSFDFRAIGGEILVAERLKASVGHSLTETPSFFTLLARDALRRKTAFPQAAGFFQGGEGEIDLKELASQFVLYARLYSLRDGLAETNTWRRLEALADSGSFSPALAADCAEAYGTLMRLRLERRASAARLPLKAFRPGEQALLKEAFAQASLVQKKIAFDFPGSAI